MQSLCVCGGRPLHIPATQHRGRGVCTPGGPARACGERVCAPGGALCARGGAPRARAHVLPT